MAAVLCRTALDAAEFRPRRIVSLNGALLPFGGVTGRIAPGLARALYANPIAPRVFAFLAGEDSVRRLIGNMGSKIDRDGVRQYRTLMANPGHVAAALGMMTHWDLDGSLAADLPRLPVPLTLVTAANDRAVPPATATAVRAILPSADIVALKGGRPPRPRGETGAGRRRAARPRAARRAAAVVRSRPDYLTGLALLDRGSLRTGPERRVEDADILTQQRPGGWSLRHGRSAPCSG